MLSRYFRLSQRRIGFRFSSNYRSDGAQSYFDEIDTTEAGKCLTTVLGILDDGFIVNNVTVRHPVLLFKEQYLIWENINSVDDIDIPSLSIFPFLKPSVELLLIGCGEQFYQPLPKDVLDHYRHRGIVIEMMTTFHAANTFNVLNAEHRRVCAALCLPKSKGTNPYAQYEQMLNIPKRRK